MTGVSLAIVSAEMAGNGWVICRGTKVVTPKRGKSNLYALPAELSIRSVSLSTTSVLTVEYKAPGLESHMLEPLKSDKRSSESSIYPSVV